MHALWARGSVAHTPSRDGQISKWRLQSMYKRLHGNIIAGEQMLASKNTQSSLKGLPRSTVVIATYSNNFKRANLKRPKSEFSTVHLSFFNQSSAVTRKVLRSKLPPVTRKFSGNSAFTLCFERNCDITPALFDRGD